MALAQPLPEYTILHFGNGFNDLDKYILADVNQMELVGSTKKIQVVAQLGSTEANTVRRFFIQKDSDTAKINSPMLQDLGRVDMGSWKVLTEFILWGMKNFPAKRYFVIIGGHGNGWTQSSSDTTVSSNPIREISPDYNTHNKITTSQLAAAFETVRKMTGKEIAIFGADACLMASVEVGTQISSSVNVMVASEENEPGEGWVYHDLLMRLNRESDMSPRNVGRVAAKSYIEGYRHLGSDYYHSQKLTISASDLSELAKFSGKLGKLTKIIATSKDVTEYNKALNSARRYGGKPFADVGDLLSNILKLPLDEVNRRTIKELYNDYETKVVIRDHASAPLAYSTGLHIWAPANSYDADRYYSAYSQLLFHKMNSWGALFVRR